MKRTSVVQLITPTALVAILFFLGCAYPSLGFSNDADDSGHEAAFVEWAKKNAVSISTTQPGSGFDDLMPLKGIIGDARVVGFGESIHTAHEFNELKVRIFEFMVREMGFTAFVMESGLTNGKLVYDYVLGADIARDTVLWKGFSYGFGVWEETVALLDFMRAYNADPSHSRKIHFYGADPFAMGLFNEYRRTGKYSIEAALEYLDIVDPDAAAPFRESLLPKIALFGSDEEYLELDPDLRVAMTVATQALVTRLSIYRVPYIEKTSREEYEWAYRHAIVARQVDNHFAFHATKPPQLDVGTGREMAQADNIKWILEQEGPDGRVMLWEHNGHVVKEYSSSDRFWIPGVGPMEEIEGKITLVGLYLDSMYGDDYMSIGFANNRFLMQGEAGQLPQFEHITDAEPALEGSYSAALRRVGIPIFALDLHAAPQTGPVHQWLTRKHLMRYENFYMNLVPLEAWDALIYVDEITPGHLIFTDEVKKLLSQRSAVESEK